MKVKSIEHLKKLSEVGSDGMEHFEGYVRLNHLLYQNMAIYYERNNDSWEIVNESSETEREYNSTKEMIKKEEILVQAINTGSVWTHGRN